MRPEDPRRAREEVARVTWASLPPRAQEAISVAALFAEERGHAFDRGLHVGWAWGTDEGRLFLDLLWEHRMAGISAHRHWQDGTTESIPTPAEFRVVDPDPEEDKRRQQEYIEHNRRAYADLRARGLLPPVGENVGSQDVNEYLRSESGD